MDLKIHYIGLSMHAYAITCVKRSRLPFSDSEFLYFDTTNYCKIYRFFNVSFVIRVVQFIFFSNCCF